MISGIWKYFIVKKFGFEVKLQISAHLGSDLEVDWKWVNFISKWRSWREHSKESSHEATGGHRRSQIQNKSQISILSFQKKLVSRSVEVTEG